MAMDKVSEERLETVYPELARRIRTMADILEGEGVHLRVTQGLRSWHDQDQLWMQGRDRAGNVVDAKTIVTHAPPGHSWHNFALAVDVVPMSLEGQPDWNPKHPVWDRIIKVGAAMGLDSGSVWRTFPDYPHFQMPNIPVSPTDEVRQVFKDGGILAVWQSLPVLT